MYPSGARANQPPAAPPIEDYNLLEECPTQPGIHPGVTWVAALGGSEAADREESVADRDVRSLPVKPPGIADTNRVCHNNNDDTRGRRCKTD